MVTSGGASGHSAYRHLAPTPPSQRVNWRFGTPERSAVPSLRGSGPRPASPADRTMGAAAVMYQPLILAIWASDNSLVLEQSADGDNLPVHAH